MLTQAELALSSHCHCMVYPPAGPPISTGYNQLCGPTLGGPSHLCNIHHRLIHGTWSNVLYALDEETSIEGEDDGKQSLAVYRGRLKATRREGKDQSFGDKQVATIQSSY